MKNNKSPGSDGFIAEFHKLFWKDLKTYQGYKPNINTATISYLADIRDYVMSSQRG